MPYDATGAAEYFATRRTTRSTTAQPTVTTSTTMTGATTMSVTRLRATMDAVNMDILAVHFDQEEGEDDPEPYVVCDGVSVAVFNRYVGEDEDLPIALRFLELTVDGRVLVVDFPSRVHEATIDEFKDAFLEASGNRRAIAKAGSMTARRAGNPNREADATYSPMPRTPNRRNPPAPRTLDDWVTFAVEVGRSQTWPSLENAARWWYGYGGVKYVLLIKVSPRGQRLHYRLYDVANNPLVNGALPVVNTVHILGAIGPPAIIVLDTREILAIPQGQGLPAGMHNQTVVDMQAVRDIVAETFRRPRG